MEQLLYFQQPSRAAQNFFYLMTVDKFFWCIFACCLRFSALSILANVRLEPVHRTKQKLSISYDTQIEY